MKYMLLAAVFFVFAATAAAYVIPDNGSLYVKLYSLLFNSTNGVRRALTFTAGAVGLGIGFMKLAMGGSPVQCIVIIIASAGIFVIQAVMTSFGAVY